MAFETNYVTMIGNVTADPELRFTATGVAVCNVRIASNRKFTKGDGTEGESTLFINGNCWRDLAENVAKTFRKGDRAILIGRLETRSYEKGGQTVWVTEIECDEVAPSLRWAHADIHKAAGGTSNGYAAPNGDGQPVAVPAVEEDVPF